MGDTNFIIRLQNSQGKNKLSREHYVYNTKCPTSLQIDGNYYWGYVYFRQVKDIKLPRGYFQKVGDQIFDWILYPFYMHYCETV